MGSEFNDALNLNPQQLKDIRSNRALHNFKHVMSVLWDNNQEALNALKFITMYKEQYQIYKWLYDNKLYGQRLADFFKNESTQDGGGYHLGVTYILSRLKGHKHYDVGIKVDELK